MENVDPDFVTAALALDPTFSQRLGEPLRYSNGADVPSHLGTWKLKLPGGVPDDPVDAQIERWIEILNPKLAALQRLISLGYDPYLDCPYLRADLSVCIDANLLKALGDLGIALSIWFLDGEPPGP